MSKTFRPTSIPATEAQVPPNKPLQLPVAVGAPFGHTSGARS